jgi:hypothetical protein
MTSIKEFLINELRDVSLELGKLHREVDIFLAFQTQGISLAEFKSRNKISRLNFINNFVQSEIVQINQMIQQRRTKTKLLRLAFNLITISLTNNTPIILTTRTADNYLAELQVKSSLTVDDLQILYTVLDYYLEDCLLTIDIINTNFEKTKSPKVEFRKTRLIPRSIPRTFERFFDELQLVAEDRYIDEFYLSRKEIFVAVRSLIVLLIVPVLTTQLIKTLLLEPLVTYEWNSLNDKFFLNAQQEQIALQDLRNFEDQIYFEELVRVADKSNALIGGKPVLTYMNEANSVITVKDVGLKTENLFDVENERIALRRLETKMLRIAKDNNDQSIDTITNLLGDIITIMILGCLFVTLKTEISIIKSVIGEILYSLSDTAKSFVIILLTDLLVGFHSPKGWNIIIQTLLDHFALPQNEEFIFLCVATFPVLLDTAFKYWIFRYLNRLSPSTVVTYHNMIE